MLPNGNLVSLNYKMFCLKSMSILAFLAFWLVSLSVQEDYDCEANFDKAEKCFQQLMFLGKQVKWDKESFQALCHSEFDAISCIQEYKQKCVKGVASMVFNLLNKKFNSTFNHLCKEDDAMEEFLEHYSCLKDSLMSDQSKRCLAQYHLRLEMIDQVKKDDKFPIICCSFYEIKECIGKELRSGCKNEKSIEYMNNMVTKFVGDLNKMFCADWQTLEVCHKNLPADIAGNFQNIDSMDLQTAENNKKIKSFLRLLKHLIEVSQ